MTRPPEDFGGMRSFLTAIAAASGSGGDPSAVTNTKMLAFLADVRRMRTDAVDLDRVPLPVVTELATATAFFEDIRRLSGGSSPFAAVPDVWGLARIGRDEQRNARILA